MLSASYNDDAANWEQDRVDVANAEPAGTIFTSTCHGGTSFVSPWLRVKTVTVRVSLAR